MRAQSRARRKIDESLGAVLRPVKLLAASGRSDRGAHAHVSGCPGGPDRIERRRFRGHRGWSARVLEARAETIPRLPGDPASPRRMSSRQMIGRARGSARAEDGGCAALASGEQRESQQGAHQDENAERRGCRNARVSDHGGVELHQGRAAIRPGCASSENCGEARQRWIPRFPNLWGPKWNLRVSWRTWNRSAHAVRFEPSRRTCIERVRHFEHASRGARTPPRTAAADRKLT